MAVPPLPGQAPDPPSLIDLVGDGRPTQPDPAWQPPRDPLEEDRIRRQAGVIHREIPNTVISTGWTVGLTRSALSDLVVGLFDRPGQLVDAVIGDSRVQSALASRLSILGRPVDFRLPVGMRDSAAAKECLDAFVGAWPIMAAEPILSQLQTWAVMLGFGAAQILWDTSGRYAIPHPRPWHPRYSYYHWIYRCYVAITMDGQTPILPGDGHWILHAPWGEYRGWMRAAVRAIAPWWLARNYALRDWARWSERHGLPQIKAKHPATGDPVMINNWRNSLQALGQETVISCPTFVDKLASFDLELLEAKDAGWEGFKALIAACSSEITLALQSQNLAGGDEVKEGSYAAARVHADVRQSLLEADARALMLMIYSQLARPFAAMNFGEPALAPRVRWNVAPYEDNLTAAQTFFSFAQALTALRNAGLAPKDTAKLARDFGLELGKLVTVDVPQVENTKASAKAAVATAKEQGKLAAEQQKAGARIAQPRFRFETIADLREAREALREALAAAEQLEREERARPRRRVV